MHPPRILLGVNIDHIATLRQARGTRYPDPVQAALLAEEAGADGITVHLREDRRHIQPRDVRLLAEVLNTRMNLEMAVTEEMLALAEEVRPAHVCLVPEKREELTTEGGLDVVGGFEQIASACQRLAAAGCRRKEEKKKKIKESEKKKKKEKKKSKKKIQKKKKGKKRKNK